jgi:hypothetical protein
MSLTKRVAAVMRASRNGPKVQSATASISSKFIPDYAQNDMACHSGIPGTSGYEF